MTDFNELSFEQAFEELAGVIAKLESGELTLEESVTLYERGQGLTKYCQQLLDEAELKINQLNDDGSITPLVS